jgi:hypothetical protein
METVNMEQTVMEGLLSIMDETESIKDIYTYEQAGMLTTDRGLIVTDSDGNEFQVTIVKSK